jgi:Helix-turn-helix domain
LKIKLFLPTSLTPPQITRNKFPNFVGIKIIVMAAFDLITKDDLEKFKIELFAELRRPSYKLNRKDEQKEWLKSFEVRKLLNISPGTLSTLRRNGTLHFSKVGGLIYYKHDDILKMLEGK